MPNIAILMSRWTLQSYDVVRGIYDFAHSIPDWNLQTFEEPRTLGVRSAQAWHAHALVCLTDPEGPTGTNDLTQSALPVVLVGTQLPTPCLLPAATLSVASLGQLIMQHLQSVHYERVLWVSQREDERISSSFASFFGDRLSEHVLKLPQAQLLQTQPEATDQLQRWLGDRARSSVVITSDEHVAVYLKRLAIKAGWQIPQEMAVISLRDGLGLGLPANSITSVMEPNHELGYQAARLVFRLLNSQPMPSEPVLVDALHLTCRGSSVESGQDLAIERAVKFINENATRGITVSEVMTFQQTSRVTFERQFQATLGCTPGDYIRRIKVQKACELLTQTTQTVESIGKACGYHSPAKFSSFFKRAMGVSPAAYRRRPT